MSNKGSTVLDLLRRLIEKERDWCLATYDEVTAYKEWLVKANALCEENGVKLDDFEKDELFPKPAYVQQQEELNESGDRLLTGEYDLSDQDFKLESIEHFGWLNDEAWLSISQDNFYRKQVKPMLGSMPSRVKDSIELHARHILGRCNNPKDWTTNPVSDWDRNFNLPKNWCSGLNDRFFKNKQGLVYGMVQSGKTANMIALMGLAQAAGFKLCIILSGHTTSLRKQTQKRISEAFAIPGVGGSSDVARNKAYSITNEFEDYGDIRNKRGSALDVWSDALRSDFIIISVMKQSDHLKKLNQDIRDLADSSDFVGCDFHQLPTLIIDDEADHSSQNNNQPQEQPSEINRLLSEIRKGLSQNTYVAYTATPQRCIGGDPHALIGYPNDFIWLLDPYRNEKGETTTYMGYEEFYQSWTGELLVSLSNESWPFYLKEDGKKKGVYKSDGSIDQSRLATIEKEHIANLLNAKNNEADVRDFIKALCEFIVTCSIRWHRHCTRFPHYSAADNGERELPRLIDIEKGSERWEDFPYHAMMFNLSMLNAVQSDVVQMVQNAFDTMVHHFEVARSKNWNPEEENVFVETWKRQIEKSKNLGFSQIDLPDLELLEYLSECAIKIAQKTILGQGNFVYQINSHEEGTKLDYANKDYKQRPKKASIIVGGQILSRGLTIENLSVSVFARSQVMSMGDTNLQMCRWFGHKKKDADLQSLYIQYHARELFQAISVSDINLREQFWKHIFYNTPMECMLLTLQNNPLFKATSPSTSYFLQKTDKSAFSGTTVDCLQPLEDDNYASNFRKLKTFLQDSGCSEKGFMHDRAFVYRSVDTDRFLRFFSSLSIGDDADFINPKAYIDYLSEWKEENGRIPEINIAVFGCDNDGEFSPDTFRNRARSGAESFLQNQKADSSFAGRSIRSLRGGKSQGSYLGDSFVDRSAEKHRQLYSEKFLKRSKHEAILVMFYLLNPNYMCRGWSLEKEDVGYSNPDVPIVTFSIATPKGGPKYQVSFNSARERMRTIQSQSICEEYEDQLNGGLL